MPQTLNEFQRRCRDSAFYPHRGSKGGIFYCCIGLSGEGGEVANELKKCIRDDSSEVTLDRAVKILGEATDCMWYAANLCAELGWSLEEAVQLLFGKIEARKLTRDATLGGGQ